ncbi:MAG: hypothetical protein GX175_06450 [Halanaerobiaceae bacterium]|jgi:cell division protein FtsW (lipid II flippase)|nr:hypothetical protein [Halanaerobiaceae bacterium]
MTEYIKKHEEYLRSILSSKEAYSEEFLKYHLRQISWIQHERLVHLLVMFFAAFLLILSFTALYLTGSWPFALLFLLLLVLTCFYIKHYYFLENTVQRWYRIANYLNKELTGTGTEL